MAKFSNDKRKQRIQELIAKLERGEVVGKRDFETAVGRELSETYKERWAEQHYLRHMKVPSAVKEYEDLLQKALLMDGRYEATLGSKGTVKLGNKAESLFEDALSRLEEIISVDQSLRIWFDRDIDFDTDGKLGHNAGQMPRVITSKSSENKAKDGLRARFGFVTKAELKLAMLKEALDEPENKVDMQKLRGMLAKIGK